MELSDFPPRKSKILEHPHVTDVKLVIQLTFFLTLQTALAYTHTILQSTSTMVD